MPRNSSGVYTLPLPPVVPDTVIESNVENTTNADMAQALTDSLDRGGAGGMNAPFKFVNGTVSAPGASWSSEPSTGEYRESAGVISRSITGAKIAQWSSFGLTMVTGKKISIPDAPTASTDAANKTYVDTKLPLTGGTLTGPLIIDTQIANNDAVIALIAPSGKSPIASFRVISGVYWDCVGGANFSLKHGLTVTKFEVTPNNGATVYGNAAKLAIVTNTEDGSDQFTLINQNAGGAAQGFIAMAGASVNFGNHRADGYLNLYAGGTSCVQIGNTGSVAIPGTLVTPKIVGNGTLTFNGGGVNVSVNTAGFVGNLTGNATSATQAVNATNVNGPAGTVTTQTLTVNGNAGVIGTLSVAGTADLGNVVVEGSLNVLVSTTGKINANVYTPVMSIGTGSILPTSPTAHWMQINDQVRVVGTAQTTSLSGSMGCELSLPIPSDLQIASDLLGGLTAAGPTLGLVLGISANTTTNRALFNAAAVPPASTGTLHFDFMYTVR